MGLLVKRPVYLPFGSGPQTEEAALVAQAGHRGQDGDRAPSLVCPFLFLMVVENRVVLVRSRVQLQRRTVQNPVGWCAGVAVTQHLRIRRVSGTARGTRQDLLPIVERQFFRLIDVDKIVFGRQNLVGVVQTGHDHHAPVGVRDGFRPAASKDDDRAKRMLRRVR